jgi:ABC-type multidrug transport system fused ATPase/permease subunit
VAQREAEIVADAWPDRSFSGRVATVATEAEFTPRNIQTRTDRDRLVYRVEVASPTPTARCGPACRSRSGWGGGAMTAAVSVRGLRRTVRQGVAVDGLDLHVPAGEIYGLVGPDGAGKTTTVRAIAGLIDPRPGGAAGDSVITPTTPRCARQLGLMPQRFSLYGDLSVAENLNFFRQLFGLSAADARPRASPACSTSRGSPRSSIGAPTRSRAACTRSSRSPARCCISPRSCCSTSPRTASTP